MNPFKNFLTAASLAATLAGTARACYSIVADEGYVYATHPSDGGFAVSVFDAGDPKAPELVRTLRAPGTPSTGITISGDVGYVGNGSCLYAIDLCSPEKASSIRTLKDGFHDRTALGAAAVGSSLLVEGEKGVRLYDISDPFAPVLDDALPARATSPLAATFRFAPLFSDGACRLYELTRNGLAGRGLAGIATNSTCFFVSSGVLYEADRSSVRIHDFSSPGDPAVRPFTNSVMRPVPSHPRGRLWVLHKGKLESWNVWKPLAPRRTRVLSFPEPALLTNAFIRGTTCYVNDVARNSLRIFSLAGDKAVELSESPFPGGKGGPPRAAAAAVPPGKADIVTDGRLLFTTTGTNSASPSIGVYDVSSPGEIRPAASWPMAIPPVGLALCPGTNLLFAVDGFGLHVFSFSTNAALTELASLAITDFEPYGPQAVAVDPRGIVLLACRMDGVKSLNLAHLSQPALADASSTGCFARDVACSDGKVFVADDTAGTTVFDLSGDGALELFRTIPVPYGSSAGLAARPGLVCAASLELPLALFATRPHPQCVGLCETGRDASFRLGRECVDVALVARGGATNALTAFVIDRAGGVLVCDVTTPREARAIGVLGRKDGALPRPVAVTSFGTRVYFLTDTGEVRGLDASRPFVPAGGPGGAAPGAGPVRANAPAAATDGGRPK